MSAPRGLRNNNPGNIVVSGWTIRQPGYSGPEPEGRFATFATMAHGIAALIRLLLVYRREHGLGTVRGIIDRWAPPAENDTGAYVRHVASLLMVDADLTLPDVPDTYLALAKAIAVHECGPEAAQLSRADFALARALVWPESQGQPVAVPASAPDASPAPAPATEARSGETASRLAHNQETAGSTPASATSSAPWPWRDIVRGIGMAAAAVNPIAGMAITLGEALLGVLPQFAGGSAVATRNIKVTQELGGALVKAARQVVPEQPNEQAAVEAVLQSPELQQRFRAQVAISAEEIGPLIELALRLGQADTASADAATERVLKLSAQSPARAWPFLLVACGQWLLTAGTIAGLFALIWPLVGAIGAGKEIADVPSWIAGIIGSVFAAVILEWRSITFNVTGRSQSSDAKDALIGRLAQK